MIWKFENMVIIVVLLALTTSCSFNTEDSETINSQSTKEKTATTNSITQIIQQMDSLSTVNQTKLDTGKRMVKTMKEHLIETVELKNIAEELLKNELPNDKSIEQFDKKYGKQIEIFKQEIQKDIDEVGFVGEITDLSNYLLLVNLNKQRILEIKGKLENTTLTTPRVIVVPCANGYEYEMYNYDMTSIIEKELKKSNSIELLPFPYKKLMNESYQGVFDKKYCNPIIENVTADFLILSRFTDDNLNKNHEPNKWGYETRIIDCKTKEQINSLSLNKAKDFNELEYHLKRNISTLVEDLNHFLK